MLFILCSLDSNEGHVEGVCGSLSSSEGHILTPNGHFAFLSTPLSLLRGNVCCSS